MKPLRKAVAIALTLATLQIGIASLTTPLYAQSTHSVPASSPTASNQVWTQGAVAAFLIAGVVCVLVCIVVVALLANKQLSVQPTPPTALD